MNNFYQNLIQSDDYEPAQAGLKETESSIFQGMIAKLSSDMDQLKVSQQNNNESRGSNSGSNNGNTGNNGRICFICGSKDYIKPQCPQNKNRRDNTPAWRLEKPKQGEPEEKKVENITYKF